MKVIGNRLLVEFVEETKEAKENEIVLVREETKASDKARVVLLGNEVDGDLVAEGDIVVVDRYFGNEIDVDGNVCHVVAMESVLVVL